MSIQQYVLFELIGELTPTLKLVESANYCASKYLCKTAYIP